MAEIDRASDALAHSFVRLGVKPGDRVALVLPNAPQNPLYTDRELEESLGASQPETVVTLTPFYERVKRCQRATGVKRSSQ